MSAKKWYEAAPLKEPAKPAAQKPASAANDDSWYKSAPLKSAAGAAEPAAARTAVPEMLARPSAPRVPGNIDLHNRPRHQNEDGSYSTVLSASFGTPDGEVLVPLIADDGHKLTVPEAIKEYDRTGKHLGIFDTSDEADAYAKQLHEDQASEYSNPLAGALFPNMPAREPPQLPLSKRPIEYTLEGTGEQQLGPPISGIVGQRVSKPSPHSTSGGPTSRVRLPEIEVQARRPQPDTRPIAGYADVFNQNWFGSGDDPDARFFESPFSPDLSTEIGSGLEMTNVGAQEMLEAPELQARKRYWQAVILPDAVQRYRERLAASGGEPVPGVDEDPFVIDAAQRVGYGNRIDLFIRDWLPLSQMSPEELEAYKEENRAQIQPQQARRDELAHRRQLAAQVASTTRPNFESDWSGPAIAWDLSASSPEFLTAAGVGSIAGPLAGALTIGGLTTPKEFAAAKNMGFDDSTALFYGVAKGAAETLPEIKSLDVILKTPAGKQVLKNIFGKLAESKIGHVAGAMTAEAGSEMLTEAMGIGIEKGIIDQNTPFLDAIERLGRAGMLGGIMGGAIGVPTSFLPEPPEIPSRAFPAPPDTTQMPPPTPDDFASILAPPPVPLQPSGAREMPPPEPRQEPFIPESFFAPELPLRDPNVQPNLPLTGGAVEPPFGVNAIPPTDTGTMPPPSGIGSPAQTGQAVSGLAPTPAAPETATQPAAVTPPVAPSPLSSAFEPPAAPAQAAPPAPPAPPKPASATAPQAAPADSTGQEKAGGATFVPHTAPIASVVSSGNKIADELDDIMKNNPDWDVAGDEMPEHLADWREMMKEPTKFSETRIRETYRVMKAIHKNWSEYQQYKKPVEKLKEGIRAAIERDEPSADEAAQMHDQLSEDFRVLKHYETESKKLLEEQGPNALEEAGVTPKQLEDIAHLAADLEAAGSHQERVAAGHKLRLAVEAFARKLKLKPPPAAKKSTTPPAAAFEKKNAALQADIDKLLPEYERLERETPLTEEDFFRKQIARDLKALLQRDTKDETPFERSVALGQIKLSLEDVIKRMKGEPQQEPSPSPDVKQSKEREDREDEAFALARDQTDAKMRADRVADAMAEYQELREELKDVHPQMTKELDAELESAQSLIDSAENHTEYRNALRGLEFTAESAAKIARNILGKEPKPRPKREYPIDKRHEAAAERYAKRQEELNRDEEKPTPQALIPPPPATKQKPAEFVAAQVETDRAAAEKAHAEYQRLAPQFAKDQPAAAEAYDADINDALEAVRNAKDYGKYATAVADLRRILDEAVNKATKAKPRKPPKTKPPQGPKPEQASMFGEEGEPTKEAEVEPYTGPTPEPYGSGLSRRKDLRAGMASQMGVGVTITELPEKGMDDIAHAIAQSPETGKGVFVDSGAYSVHAAAVKAGRDPDENPDFSKVIEKYDKLSEKVQKAVPKNDVGQRGMLMLVAPDVVGNQAATMKLIEKHADDINRWIGAGHEVIIPFQSGPIKQSEFYQRVVDVLGHSNFVVGIPSKAKAMPNSELTELLDQPYAPQRLHILGAAKPGSLEKRMEVIRAHDTRQEIGVTADANLARSKLDRLKGLTGQARADEITKILNESKGERPSKPVEGLPPIEEEPTDAEILGVDEDIGTRAARGDDEITDEELGEDADEELGQDIGEMDDRGGSGSLSDSKLGGKTAPTPRAPTLPGESTPLDPLQIIAQQKAEALAADIERNRPAEVAPKRDMTLQQSLYDTMWRDLHGGMHPGETTEEYAIRQEAFVQRMRNLPIKEQLTYAKSRLKLHFDFKGIEIDPNLADREALDAMLDAYNNLHTQANVMGQPRQAMGFNGELTMELAKKIGRSPDTRGQFNWNFAQGFGASVLSLARRADSFTHEWLHALDFNLLMRFTRRRDIGVTGASKLTTKILPELPKAIHDAFQNVMRAILLTDQASMTKLANLTLDAAQAQKDLTKARQQLRKVKSIIDNEAEREKKAAQYEKEANNPKLDPFLAAARQRAADTLRAGSVKAKGQFALRKVAVEKLEEKLRDIDTQMKDTLLSKASTLAQSSRFVDFLQGRPYFAIPAELFARAGESCLATRVGQQAGTEFLTGGPQFYNENTDEIMKLVYPNEADRVRIFSAFDDLFLALATDQYFAGDTVAAKVPQQSRLEKELWLESQRNAQLNAVRQTINATASDFMAVMRLIGKLRHPISAGVSLALGTYESIVRGAEGAKHFIYQFYTARGRMNGLISKAMAQGNKRLAAKLREVARHLTDDPGSGTLQEESLEQEYQRVATANMNELIDIAKEHGLDIEDQAQMKQLYEELAKPNAQVQAELREYKEFLEEKLAETQGDRNKVRTAEALKFQLASLEKWIAKFDKPSGATPRVIDAAVKIRKFMDRIYYDQQKAGIDMGYIGNYLWRIMSDEAIDANRNGFVDQATAVYDFENHRKARSLNRRLGELESELKVAKSVARNLERGEEEVDAIKKKMAEVRTEIADLANVDTLKKAREWLHSTQMSDMFQHDRSTPPSNYTKERKLGPIADILLSEFYDQNPLSNLSKYIPMAAKRQAYSRRFGNDHSKYRLMRLQLQAADISKEDMQVVDEQVKLVSGTHNPTISKGLRTFTNTIYNTATMALLPFSLFAQLAEPLVAGIRTGRLRDGMVNLFYTMQQVFNTGNAAEMRQIGEIIGLVSTAGTDTIVQNRMFQEDMSAKTAKVTGWFYRVTGNHGYTTASRIATMKLGGRYLNAWASKYKNSNPGSEERAAAEEEFRELGVPHGMHKAFVDFILKQGEIVSINALLDPTDAEVKKFYVVAMTRFVDSIIGNPKAGDRPRMAFNPIGRFIMSIASFNYYFQRHVLARFGKRFARSDTKFKTAAQFIIPYLALMIGAMGARMLREWLVNRERFKQRVEELASVKSFFNAVDASGGTGAYSPVYNWLFKSKYKKELSTIAMGAAAGFYVDSIQDIMEGVADTQDPKDRTSTGERKATKATYRLAVNMLAPRLLSSMGLNGPLAWAALMYATSYDSANDFANATVDKTANERAREAKKARKRPETPSTLKRKERKEERKQDKIERRYGK